MSVIRLTDIRKRFGETQALAGVSFDLREGEIHALLGENGAGKTTLMNVLYGLIRPDSGTIEVAGREVAFHSPRDAIRAGVGMVHQHFMLVPTLSVAENVLLGAREAHPFWFRRRRANAETARLSEEFSLEVNPAAEVGTLPVGVQQRVELLKCLARRARVLVLDEPTAVLTPQEVEDLNETLRRLREAGRSIVFISHKLKEVIAVCDRVTVLRQGRNVGTVPVEQVDERSLSEMMVGRVLDEERPGAPIGGSRPVVLETRDLTVSGARGVAAVKGLNLAIRAGEIYGLAGIDGNGQMELMEALAGVRSVVAGSILLNGEPITSLSPRKRANRGLALITDDRQQKGLVLDFSIAENLILKRYRSDPFSRWGWLLSDARDRFAATAIREYGIQASGPTMTVGTLSGGNQQKVVIAREMAHAAAALVAVNPTRGLDVGATETVHRTLIEARNEGRAILLISTELDEVLKLSDRIGVMFRGRVRELPHARADRTTIGRWMLGQGSAG